jgi:nucleoside transporter
MNATRVKLCVMMFLEFFIWGAWLPKIFGYLDYLEYSPLQKGLILNAFAVSSLLAMFFSTQFVDRNFAAEKFLAFSQLVGGLAILGLFWIEKGPPGSEPPFWPFFGLMLVHCLFYVPTISITNSIAFANLEDPQREFGPVRLWGTIGWIAASWPFVFILTGDAALEGVKYTYLVAGLASLLLAGFSLSLPHTPPRPATGGMETFAWLEAVKLLRVPFVLVLFLVTFVDATVHMCYFIWTDTYLMSIGIESRWVMPVMSIGQVAEIGTMAILGYCLKTLGWRWTMTIGILGHAVRFALFALAPYPAVAIVVNLLHGICYAFFFATVYIFVDEFFPKDARASAQGLFNFLILGLGPFLANFLWPYLGAVFKVPGAAAPTNFGQLFLVPSGVALVAAIALFIFFHPPPRSPEVLAKAFREDDPDATSKGPHPEEPTEAIREMEERISRG